MTSRETYQGLVRTPLDAIYLFEACRQGLLPRVQRRLSEKERQAITVGSVFVWDEREAGMRRWTDGKSWSASRVSGSFLTYREMEGNKRSDGIPDEDEANRQDGEDSNVVSAASDGYRYKPNGLMKQSFSILTANNLKLHLISYFSRSNIPSSKLMQPSLDPKLKHIQIPPGLYPDSTTPIDNPHGIHSISAGLPPPMPGMPMMGPRHPQLALPPPPPNHGYMMPPQQGHPAQYQNVPPPPPHHQQMMPPPQQGLPPHVQHQQHPPMPNQHVYPPPPQHQLPPPPPPPVQTHPHAPPPPPQGQYMSQGGMPPPPPHYGQPQQQQQHMSPAQQYPLPHQQQLPPPPPPQMQQQQQQTPPPQHYQYPPPPPPPMGMPMPIPETRPPMPYSQQQQGPPPPQHQQQQQQPPHSYPPPPPPPGYTSYPPPPPPPSQQSIPPHLQNSMQGPSVHQHHHHSMPSVPSSPYVQSQVQQPQGSIQSPSLYPNQIPQQQQIASPVEHYQSGPPPPPPPPPPSHPMYQASPVPAPLPAPYQTHSRNVSITQSPEIKRSPIMNNNVSAPPPSVLSPVVGPPPPSSSGAVGGAAATAVASSSPVSPYSTASGPSSIISHGHSNSSSSNSTAPSIASQPNTPCDTKVSITRRSNSPHGLVHNNHHHHGIIGLNNNKVTKSPSVANGRSSNSNRLSAKSLLNSPINMPTEAPRLPIPVATGSSSLTNSPSNSVVVTLPPLGEQRVRPEERSYTSTSASTPLRTPSLFSDNKLPPPTINGNGGILLPSLSSLNVQEAPVEKGVWREDVRAIQVLDKGFIFN